MSNIKRKNKEEKRADVFILTIDKDRAEILNIMATAMALMPGIQILFSGSRDRTEALQDFIQEISDKTHEQGWCTDPECEHNQKKD